MSDNLYAKEIINQWVAAPRTAKEIDTDKNFYQYVKPEVIPFLSENYNGDDFAEELEAHLRWEKSISLKTETSDDDSTNNDSTETK